MTKRPAKTSEDEVTAAIRIAEHAGHCETCRNALVLAGARLLHGSAPVRLADFGGNVGVEGVSDYRSAFFWRRIAGPTTVTPRCVHSRRRHFWRDRVEAAMRHDKVLQSRTDERNA